MAKEEAKIKVHIEKRSFGKYVTIVEGIDPKTNPKELAKKLKSKLATGGTFKDNKIELQGNHLSRIKKLLIELGFSEKQIEVE